MEEYEGREMYEEWMCCDAGEYEMGQGWGGGGGPIRDRLKFANVCAV